MAEVKHEGPSILAVIVLYQMRPEDSPAYHTLRAAISRLEAQAEAVPILLYDNTPNALAPRNLPRHVLYVPGGRNEGIAGAYNYALRWAARKHFAWMLTLDQDTRLPPEFLLRMRAIALRLKEVNEVGAIVPHLLSRGRLLSPVRIRPWGVTYLRRHTAGFATGEVHAFNSASLFRVRALEQINGCHPGFWLDYQDAYLYTKLHQCGRKIYIAEDLEVEHDLSLLSASRPVGRAFQEFPRGGVGLLRLIPGANQWTLPHRTAAWPHLAPMAKWRRCDSSTIDPQAVPAAYLCHAQSAAECVAQWNRTAALQSAAYGRAACDLGLPGCVQRRTVYRGTAKFDSYSTGSHR